MTNIINKNKSQIEKICLEEGISYLALFGSYARGDQNSKSDVDLLVEYEKPVGFFELYDTEEKLKQIFHKKIDLVTTNGIKKSLYPYIKSDLTTIYEKKLLKFGSSTSLNLRKL